MLHGMIPPGCPANHSGVPLGFHTIDSAHSIPTGPQTALLLDIILVEYPGAVLREADQPLSGALCNSQAYFCPWYNLFTGRNMRMFEQGVSLGVGVSPHSDVSFRPLSSGKGL